MIPPRRVGLACAALLVVLGADGCGGRGARREVAPAGRAVVPRAGGPITIDGKCGEPSWQTSFRSPSFIDARGRRNPSTQMRATADDENLYVEIYVADIDLESKGDVVKVELGPVHAELTPRRADVPAGVKAAMDADGTIDDPHDHDEEWITELAIPWRLLGAHEVPFRALRIDAGDGAPPHALAWPRSTPTLLTFNGR